MRRFTRFTAALALLSLSACPNVFDPLDSPSGDAQLLSAARACFDKGDLQCAADHYAKLSHLDAAVAENALLTLERVGLGVGALANAVGAGDGSMGKILTRMIESAAPYSNSTTRLQVIGAYKAIANIRSPEVKGFVRFVTGFALAALNLSAHPGIQDDRVFTKTDLAFGDTCSFPACGAPCADPARTSIPDTAGAEDDVDDFIDSPGSIVMDGTASWDKFHIALRAATTGLTEMAVEEGPSYTLLRTIAGPASALPSSNLPCYRGALLMIDGVGEQ